MHRLSTSFVLAYHGCDTVVAEGLLRGEPFNPSKNEWDWLGRGVYFWEANPKRGLEWAGKLSKRKRSRIKTPAVVGAVIDLRQCLDLTTSAGVEMVKIAHERLLETLTISGEAAPVNSTDLVKRRLDCAVINTLHDTRRQEGLSAIDSVRGVFVEGGPAYPGALIMESTHIQICVCNHDCIKGVFRVPSSDLQ